MLHTQIQFPSYDALTMSTQLSQQQYSNFVSKVAFGEIPEGKVDTNGAPLDACWEWNAYTNKDGYGQFRFGTPPSRLGKSHRVSAYIVGLIQTIELTSDEALVLHKCDNPSCVNPNHLFKGSQKNGMAKLNWAQVAAIRERYAAGGTSTYKLASEYGVDRSGIGCIIRNTSWHDKSYTPPPAKQTNLSKEQRAEVIKLYTKLATQFSVSKKTISNILRGK